MSGCLGDALAALVDGELDHAGRERVHRHLAHCTGCRAEVEAQRRVKARVRAASAPSPSDDLTARLLALAASPSPVEERDGALRPGGRPARLPVVFDTGPAPQAQRPAGPVALRRAPSPTAGPAGARPAGAPAPVGRPVRTRALRRRATAGSAFALLGVAAALALGAPPQRQPSTPGDPTTEAFVTEFVSTTGSSATRAGSPSSDLPAHSGLTFAPVTRAALLSSAATTTGGARSSR